MDIEGGEPNTMATCTTEITETPSVKDVEYDKETTKRKRNKKSWAVS